MIDWEQRCRRLQGELDEANEKIRQLQELTRPNVAFPVEWKMRPPERRLLAALLTFEVVSNELALQTVARSLLSADQLERPDILIRTNVHRLRRSLRPLGASVVCRYGVGYFLPKESKAILRAALSAAHAQEINEIN